MSELFEALMVVSFGASWPLSIVKSYRARTAQGKSLPFLVLITFGYICGIAAKLLEGKLTYVFAFYVLNLGMLIVELLLYFRNRRLDQARRG